MPRKTKATSESTTQESADSAPAIPAESSTPAAPKRARKTAGSKKTPSAKVPRKRATKTSSATAPQPATGASPTDEQIRLRAYFIAERRVQLGLPGNEVDDWIEATRQIESELGGGID